MTEKRLWWYIWTYYSLEKLPPTPPHLVTQFSIHLFIYMVLNMNTHSMKIYTPWNNFTTIPELLTKEWWYVSLHHQFSDIMILIYIIQWLSNLSGMIFPWIKNIYNDNRFSMPKYFFHPEWPQIQRISIYRPPTKVFGSWYHIKNTLNLFGKLFLVSTQNTCGSYLWVFQLSVLTKWIFYWMNHIRVKGVTPKLFFSMVLIVQQYTWPWNDSVHRQRGKCNWWNNYAYQCHQVHWSYNSYLFLIFLHFYPLTPVFWFI